MRYLRLVFLALFAAAPAMAGMYPLPDEGLTIAMPGFTFHTPGARWYIQTSYTGQGEDGSVDGAFPMVMGTSVNPEGNPLGKLFVSAIGLGNDSTAVVYVTGFVVPTAARDLQTAADELMNYMKKRADAEAAAQGRIHYLTSEFTKTTQNGAVCVRWEATAEDRGVPHHQEEAFILSMHRLACSNPEFPAHIAMIDYSTRIQPGKSLPVSDADGWAALNSLQFTHLGYRVSVLQVGRVPQMLAEADGAIWVAYGGDDGKVARIDPKTNAITATIPVGRVPVGIVADANGLWVANLKGDTVSRIDPKTNQVVATINVPKGPEFLASGAGAIWVTASGAGSVARIDPATGAVTEITGAGKQPAGIAFANGAVYVTDYVGDKVARIDPSTGKVTGAIRCGRGSIFLLPDGRYLWASDQSEHAVLRLDPEAPDAAPVRFTKGIGDKPTGLAIWNGKLWVANWGGASVSILDPQALDKTGEFRPIGQAPIGLLAAQGSLWITVVGIDAVLRLDPE
jgi:YVTN family beta-propeller protein